MDWAIGDLIILTEPHGSSDPSDIDLLQPFSELIDVV